MSGRNIEELIRTAYPGSAGCPAPEAFLESSLRELSSTERERIELHAANCPACDAERTLAAGFDEATDESGIDVADIDHVAAGLASFRSRRRILPGWGLAAAAVLLVGVTGLFVVQRSAAPALPELGTDSVMRGSHMNVLAPRGTLRDVPRTLSWEPMSGANSYRVEIRLVDDAVLHAAIVSGSSYALPEEVVRELHPAVVFSWIVEARDPQGTPIATSEFTSFRVAPQGER